MVLVGEGVELGEQLISQLMTRGIKRIVVRGTPIPGPSRATWDERVRMLDERFEHVRHYPFMSALRDIVARVMAKRM